MSENLELLKSFKKNIPCPLYNGKYYISADNRCWLITDNDIGGKVYIRTPDLETPYLEAYMFAHVTLIAGDDEMMVRRYDEIVTHVTVCGKEV